MTSLRERACWTNKGVKIQWIILFLCNEWKVGFNFPKLSYWRRKWQPTPVFLPGKSQGRRSLVGCSPWGHEESDMTERLHFHFSLSCIREGNGNPLQCSCLENPRDGGAWWAAVYGVSQSWTRLKQLSSSSSKLSYRLGNIHGNSTVALQTECWLKRKWSSLNWTFK